MIDMFSEASLVALVGLIGGVVLGLAARIGRFCTLGAIEDLFYGGTSLRLRMWGVAIGVAVIGTYALDAAGLFAIEQSLYAQRVWNPSASIIGGLLFGYGMALAGNCGYGALARIGGGDLRALLIVLIMGISAYVTLGGPLSSLRIWAFGGTEQSTGSTTFAQLASGGTGLSVNACGILIGALILGVTVLNQDMRRAPARILWGALVGLAIVSGWAGTYWIASSGFDATPIVSHTFSAPIGETVLYLMTSSGNTISFGTGSVAGVMLGAFIGSALKRQFRWEACDDPRELKRQLLGGALMGIGAVIAVGCSVGQGLSAFSTLAYGAPLTMICIIIGAAIGLRQLIFGFARTV